MMPKFLKRLSNKSRFETAVKRAIVGLKFRPIALLIESANLALHHKEKEMMNSLWGHGYPWKSEMNKQLYPDEGPTPKGDGTTDDTEALRRKEKEMMRSLWMGAEEFVASACMSGANK